MTPRQRPQIRVFLAYTDSELDRYYSTDALAVLQDCAQVVRNTSGRVLEGVDLANAASECHVVIAHRSVAGTDAAFARMPNLLAFLRCAVDISTIDVNAASARGILVTRATRGFGQAVAELGLGMMINLARGISRADHAYKLDKLFVPQKSAQLSGAVLGIVGFGLIARHLAALGRGIGMRVIVCDPHVPTEQLGDMARPFSSLLAESDFVVCLAASTAETANLFDARAMAAMKRGAFLINLSRGELVDEPALEAALDAGHIRGAGLDVGSGHDQMPTARLAVRPDVIATPHIGGMTVTARAHQAMDTVRQLVAIAAGQMPEGAANPEKAFRLLNFFASC